MATELERIEYVRDGCCSCHLNPPCSWCMELAEDEVGLDRSALEALLDVKEEAVHLQERRAQVIVGAILRKGGDSLLDAVADCIRRR